MARRKNVKRIDPRYFLNETVNRNDDGSRMEESNQCVSCLLEAGRCTCDHTGCHSNPKGRQDCDTGLRIKGLEEELDEVLEEEELEEGWKEFAQGADDFLGDLMLGKPRGYSKAQRQDVARMDADYEALSGRVAQRATRKKEKAASDRARAQDRAKRRKAQDIRNRQLDKWEAGQKEKERAERDRKSRERDRDFDGPTRAYRTTYEE